MGAVIILEKVLKEFFHKKQHPYEQNIRMHTNTVLTLAHKHAGFLSYLCFLYSFHLDSGFVAVKVVLGFKSVNAFKRNCESFLLDVVGVLCNG